MGIDRLAPVYLTLAACTAPALSNASGTGAGKSEVGTGLREVPVLYLQTLSAENTSRLGTDHDDPPVALVSFPKLIEAARNPDGLAKETDVPEIAGAGKYAIALPFFFVLGKVGGGAALGTSMAAAGKFLGGALIGLGLTWAASETVQRVVRVEDDQLGTFDVVGTNEDFKQLSETEHLSQSDYREFRQWASVSQPRPGLPDWKDFLGATVLAAILAQWALIERAPRSAADIDHGSSPRRSLPIVLLDIDDKTREWGIKQVEPSSTSPEVDSQLEVAIRLQEVLERPETRATLVMHNYQGAADLAAAPADRRHGALRDASTPIAIAVRSRPDDVVTQRLSSSASSWRTLPTTYGHPWAMPLGTKLDPVWVTWLNQDLFPHQPIAAMTYGLFLETLPNCTEELAKKTIVELVRQSELMIEDEGKRGLALLSDDQTPVHKASALLLLEEDDETQGERTRLKTALSGAIVIIGQTDGVFGPPNVVDFFGGGLHPGDYFHVWLMQKLYRAHVDNPTAQCNPLQ